VSHADTCGRIDKTQLAHTFTTMQTRLKKLCNVCTVY